MLAYKLYKYVDITQPNLSKINTDSIYFRIENTFREQLTFKV